jgi:hypothetical protein
MATTKKKAGRKVQAAKAGAKTTGRRKTAASELKVVTGGSPARPRETEASPPDDDFSIPGRPDDSDEMVVFAFRLTRAERDLIHEAAGSAKASRFVRTLALAAARGDEAALQDLLNETREKAH